MNQQNRSRLKLLGVLMVFVVPLAAAYILYYGFHDQITGGVINKGVLLKPALPLPEIEVEGPQGATTSTRVLREQWTFLQIAPDGCGATCRDSLKETRQVWLLLHNDRRRVQRVLFVGGHPPTIDHRAALQVYSGELEPLWTLITKHSPARPGTVYLVDPHGNWVLFYPPGQDGKGLFEDAKHLLDISVIG